MSSEKNDVKISKFLSLVLRHQPESIGIQLDESGWADVNDLIEKSRKAGVPFDLEILKHIVDTNSKKRFSLSEKGDKIRASQGHSIEVELGYEPKQPPDTLYHGTSIKSVESILENGLEKGKRHHVHLSIDITTAIAVGKRHGKPVVLEVMAGKMWKEGFEFFISANQVWLTDHVPVSYFNKHIG